MSSNEGIIKIALSIILFPTLFQDTMLTFAWGAHDPFWMMIFKRVFILVPVAGIISHCWLTIICTLSILIRVHRREFISLMILNWWDLGRCILHFWGGTLKFVFFFIGSLLALLRFSIMLLWAALSDFIFAPLRIAKDMGGGVLQPGVPWIAVVFTFLWCFLEATIFTFVTTPLVIDTLGTLTGQSMTEGQIQLPLFLMLYVFVLGSYAVLSTWVEAVKSKSIGAILKIGIFELFVMFLEVVFLYREFVDSLTPWIAQHTSSNFQLGLIGTMGIAGFAWLGVRGLSWFLFASAGTPTIMAIIQRKGVSNQSHGQIKGGPPQSHGSTLIGNIIGKIKADIDWVQNRGDAVLSSFLLPPLQVLAAVINFVMLLILARTIFELPFNSITEVASSKNLKGKITTDEN